eukprot:16437603-Heterocapsa_arctica.AAC.1
MPAPEVAPAAIAPAVPERTMKGPATERAKERPKDEEALMELERGKRSGMDAVDPRIALRHEKEGTAARLKVLQNQERSMAANAVHPADQTAGHIMMNRRKENAASTGSTSSPAIGGVMS